MRCSSSSETVWSGLSFSHEPRSYHITQGSTRAAITMHEGSVFQELPISDAPEHGRFEGLHAMALAWLSQISLAALGASTRVSTRLRAFFDKAFLLSTLAATALRAAQVTPQPSFVLPPPPPTLPARPLSCMRIIVPGTAHSFLSSS